MRPLPAKVFRESVLRTPASQELVNGLVIFLAVCAILYYGQPILIPIVLAILLSLLLAPCVKLLNRRPLRLVQPEMIRHDPSLLSSLNHAKPITSIEYTP